MMHIRSVGATLLGALLVLSSCGLPDDGGLDHDPANRPGYLRPDTVLPADGTGPDDHAVSGRAGSLREATFALVDSADAVLVRTADLGGDLYRITTPDDAKAAPTARLDQGTVTARLRGTGQPGAAIVTVALSKAVRWHVQLAAGAAEQVVDLRAGPPGDVDLTAGVTRAEVALPAAAGTVKVTMSGGAGQLLVHLTGTAPVQVRVGNGAGLLSVDGFTRAGVAGNTTVTPPDWAAATDRYDIDLRAGAAAVVVDRR